MIFPVVRISESEKLHEFCSVSWPRGRAPAPCYLALLNCGTSESTSTLILVESSPGVFTKLSLPSRGFIRTALEPRMAQRLVVMTIAIERTAPSRQSWEWRAGNEVVFFGDSLRSQIRTDADSAHLSPVMKPIVRPALLPRSLAEHLATSRDGYRDKVVLKGPCRSTSAFELQYVYVGNFRLTWLERGDEVHLIPKESGDQDQPCVVFSSQQRQSFMVVLRPTRTSANASLYTNIPWWEGEKTLPYMERLERERRSNTRESPCRRAVQRVDHGSQVVVQVQSRRRKNGWWVYISTDKPPDTGPGVTIPSQET